MAEYIIQEETLKKLADIIREKADYESVIRAYVQDRTVFNINSLPDGLTRIKDGAFEYCFGMSLTSLPETLTYIGKGAFMSCDLAITAIPKNVVTIAGYAFINSPKLTNLTFEGTPTSISDTAFNNCSNLVTINVPWAEGAVEGAPWGATNATINYKSTGE